MNIVCNNHFLEPLNLMFKYLVRVNVKYNFVCFDILPYFSIILFYYVNVMMCISVIFLFVENKVFTGRSIVSNIII